MYRNGFDAVCFKLISFLSYPSNNVAVLVKKHATKLINHLKLKTASITDHDHNENQLSCM